MMQRAVRSATCRLTDLTQARSDLVARLRVHAQSPC